MMASTYSTNLGIELIGTGDQSGTWGATTNTNFGTLVEQAIVGYSTQAVTDSGSATVLTIANGASSTGRNYVVELTGALTADRTVTVPAVNKPYVFFNNTSGGFSVIVKVSGQTGVTIKNGRKAIVYTNTTDVIEVANAPVTEAGTQTLTNKTLTTPVIATVTSPAATALTIQSAGTTAMTIDTSQNVGIGTSSAGTRFAVNGGTGNSQIRWNVGNSAYAESVVTNAAQSAYLYNSSDALYHVWKVTSTEQMRIDSSGNVGIGTTSPAVKLNVNGNQINYGTNPYISWSNVYNNTPAYIQYNTSTYEFKILNTGSGSDGFMTFATGGGNEAARIDSSSNVGIGITSPLTRLDVGGGTLSIRGSALFNSSSTAGTSSSAYIRSNNAVSSATNPDYTWWYNDQCGFFHPSANVIGFSTSGTEQMRIDSSGKLLVGFTSNFFGSRAQFAAASDGSSGYAAAGFQAYNGLNGVVIGNQSGTATYNGIVFVNNGSTQTFVASVQVFASSVAYNTSSDARLKENVQNAEPALNLVDSIQVRSFDWKNTGEHQRYGMIAQELQSVAPEFVNDQLDPNHTLGIDYSKLVPMLTKAIQELSAKNDALEARLAKLENVQ